MSTAIAPTPPFAPVPSGALPSVPYGGLSNLHRITVDEYHEMIATGILNETHPIELLEGLLVNKMPRSHAHDFAIRTLNKRLQKLVPDEYVLSNQCAATFDTSEPEPDFTIARGPEATYRTRHPGPADIAVVIEVSSSSLESDRSDKARIYAKGGIPIYWIVNVEECKIEVYSNPVAAGEAHYAQRVEYKAGTAVPLLLDGKSCGTIPVAELMV